MGLKLYGTGKIENASELAIESNSPSQTPLVLVGSPGQSSNFVEIKDNSDTIVAKIEPDGDFLVAGDIDYDGKNLTSELSLRASTNSPTFTGTVNMANADLIPKSQFSYKNILINGDFRVWQRGTSGTLWIEDVNIGTINASSDYRLKKNIEEEDLAWNKVKSMRPVKFHWKDKSIFKDDGIIHHGFIAHEIQKNIPSAVNYEKDSFDENNNPKFQSLNLYEIIPVLTKALQEAMDRIEDLENRIEDLGGK
jgi:hypothetical protein